MESNIAYHLTPDLFPSAHAVWGDGGFKRINKLLDDAASLVSRRYKSGKAEYAGYSETESTPPNKAVVFVDCSDGKRFYISHRHIINNELPQPIGI